MGQQTRSGAEAEGMVQFLGNTAHLPKILSRATKLCPSEPCQTRLSACRQSVSMVLGTVVRADCLTGNGEVYLSFQNGPAADSRRFRRRGRMVTRTTDTGAAFAACFACRPQLFRSQSARKDRRTPKLRTLQRSTLPREASWSAAARNELLLWD